MCVMSSSHHDSGAKSQSIKAGNRQISLDMVIISAEDTPSTFHLFEVRSRVIVVDKEGERPF